MKLKDIINKIEVIAPLSLQEEWDDSGFQIKVHDDFFDINKVYIALEITNDVIDDAINNNAELIITHHPLLFNPINRIDFGNYIQNYLIKLIENKISVYSTHTAFDSCDLGNNYYFGKLLGVNDINEFSEGPKYLRFGYIKETKLNDLILLLENKLNVDKSYFNYAGDLNLSIKKIAWCTGAGSEYLYLAKENNCDLYITGDLKYHQARDAREMGISVLDIGHYASEKIFVENISNLLNFKGVEIIQSLIDINPFVRI